MILARLSYSRHFHLIRREHLRRERLIARYCDRLEAYGFCSIRRLQLELINVDPDSAGAFRRSFQRQSDVSDKTVVVADGFALKVLSHRLCRRMCGVAMPRRSLSQSRWGSAPRMAFGP